MDTAPRTVRSRSGNSSRATSEALYTLAGTVFNTGTVDVTRNLHAASGWTGAAYTAPRSAAPFAILDVAYDAVALVLTAEPLVAFPGLRFHWSPSNVPVSDQAMLKLLMLVLLPS